MPQIKVRIRCPHCGASEEVEYNVISDDQTIMWNCVDPSCGAKTEFKAKDIAETAEAQKAKPRTQSPHAARVPRVEP